MFLENKDQIVENKEKLKRILQSVGGRVEENGKKNLLVSFEKAVVVLDGGNSLKVDGTNKINIGGYGFRIDEGFPEENEGRISIIQKVYSIPLPVEC